VLAIESRGTRHPWVTCGGAGAALAALVGAPIDRDVTALSRWGEAGLNCTHRFDLLALAIAQVARGPGERRYDVEAGPDPDMPGRHLVAVARDGREVLRWSIGGSRIHAPDGAGGRDVRHVLRWAREALDADAVEAIFMARRGLLVSTYRRSDPAAMTSAAAVMKVMAGACYAFQPERAALGVPTAGGFRDFDQAADRLLEDLER
jgi:hypothetical protein